MNIDSLKSTAGKSTIWIAWGLFLLFLPVTSFPFFPPALGGDALVRPLSLYPLLLLLILFTIPYILTRRVPRTLAAILPFVILSIVSSLLAMLRGIETSNGVTITDRMLRTLITIGIGGAFYTTIALFPRNKEELNGTLRWIYAGFGIALLWGSFQAVYILRFDRQYFRLLQHIQEYVSTRRLFTNRISGLTYEPNWFAEQITFLLLPWLLTAVVRRYSVFRWRWRWVTVETLLLGWAVIVLIFTFSRAGLANLLILAIISVLFLRPNEPQENQRRLKGVPHHSGWTRRLLEAAMILIVLTVAIYLVGTQNEFFARIWNFWSAKQNTSITKYIEYLGFGARFTYGETAYHIYTDNPLLGVGLGNFAFFFETYLPDRPLPVMPEILRLVTPGSSRMRLITPKIFYLRLLAETGIIGLAAFMAFVAAILGCAAFLWLAPAKEAQYWGRAGLLGILAFGLAAFSFDSFALPNMWVVFGLITAAARIFAVQVPDK